MKRTTPLCLITLLFVLSGAPGGLAATVTETFDSYANGTLITAVGGSGVWTIGANTVVNPGGVNGTAGLGYGSAIFNWKGQSFQWSALAVGTKVAISLDFQSSTTGKFDDDRVGWTITPDASTSTGSQLALQLDNTSEGGMVFYHNSTRTPVLNALSGIKNSTWYRFSVEYTKLTATSATIVGTLTELDASGNPTGTPYVGTIADTSTFANPPSTSLFTSAQQCPSYKNHNVTAGRGNVDNASITITPPGPQPATISITSPANDSTMTGEWLAIAATATPSTGASITNVEFYSGTTKIGEDATEPFTMNWCGVAPAAYSLTAVVLDNSGASVTSSAVNVTVSAPATAGSLQFDGSNDYVTFGTAPELGLSTFTIECWFKRQGTGQITTTGSGGVTNAVPLVTKGRGEAENSNADMNWFLGISTSGNVIAADFEEGVGGTTPGLNHPVWGNTPVINNVWYHAAATYDGASWTLYLNGNVETNVAVNQPPRSDSIQHAALASAMNSTGAAAGYFQGLLDEVRVWNYARSAAEIGDNYRLQITNQNGLVARWALNEADGTVARDANCGGLNGDLRNGPVWSTDSFDANNPPMVLLTTPAAGSVFAVGSSVTLDATAMDEGSVAEVAFYVDDELVGSDDTSPYSATWPSAELGFHALTAVARDNTGLWATSAVVNVSVVAEPGFGAVSFDGANDHIAMGAAPELGASTFTLECWMRIDGTGVTASSGNGGVNVAPLIAKGRGEGDASNLDCNYIFGVQSNNRLAADFEDMQSGLNHPIVGTAALSAGVWHHCAVTYDGSWWRIYVDGAADASLQVTGGGNVQVPRYDSIQHFALGTAMTSTGAAAGYFKGVMDEVRVWNYARTQAEISSSMYSEIAEAAGLIGRWSLNETNGTTASNTGSSGVNGTLVNGAVWATGYPLQPAANTPPTVAITSPTNGATVFTSFSISATATDFGAVSQVDFYADDITLLGSDASSPYTFDWSGAPEGAHTLTAVAWDDEGLSATSAVVNITVSTNLPPSAPVVVAPINGAVGVAADATLTVAVSDPNNDPMTVVFYGRPLDGPAPGADFTFVALPDTQFYMSSLNGGSPAIATNQVAWVIANRVSRNIQYLAQLGDCVQNGENGGNDAEWRNATNAFYRLEDPLTTFLPEGVPYGVAVGNHDQTPAYDPNGTTTFYNQYFGINHFQGYSYYGGHYGTNNDNHYDLFSASGMDFIVIYLEYDAAMTTASPVLAWANGVLETHSNRRAIVVSHYIVNPGFNATFSAQGQAIYNGLKGNTNLFLMLCGHESPEEGQRTDVYQGRAVWSIMSDYQSLTAGGNGWMRLYEFSPSNNVIHAKTYSPWLDQYKTASSNQFDIPYVMSATNPFVVIGTSTGVPSGGNASIVWTNLDLETVYEWYAVASDASLSVSGATSQFTTRPPLRVTLSLAGSPMAEAAGEATVTATLSEISANEVTVNLEFSGTATLTDDYTRSGASISIPAGNLTGSITLKAVQDTLYEVPAETIVVDIGTVDNALENGTQQVTATITDDDPVPPDVTLSLAGSPMAEAAGEATVTATLSGTSLNAVTVNLEFSGTATLTDDYTRSGASISIPAGSLTGSITLTAVQDAIYENPDETIVVDISTVLNATESGAQQVTATISDDDPIPPVMTLLDQNFDVLGSAGTTMPNDWTAGYLGVVSTQNRLTMSPYAGNGLNLTALPLVVSDGSAFPNPNVGTIFNIGSAGSSERALGSYPRTTPSGDHVLQVAIVNTTGGSLSSINVSYVGEQWRQSEGASDSGPEMLRFLVSTTSPTDGFAYYSDLNFTAPKQLVADWPVGGLDGNLAANRAAVAGTITFASPVPPGGTFYLRWHDWNDDSTSDHYLAIDDLIVRSTYLSGPTVTLDLAGSPMAEDGGVATVTATLSKTSAYEVVVNLAFAGTATLTDDYTRSGASISIPAGSLTGSITLTAVADAVYESTAETIVVDITTVDNAIESGTQQVTATITDDPAAAGFTAYNDCSKGDGTNPANTTEYPGNGSYSGLLKDFDTGATLPVTITLVTNLITYDGGGGPMPNAGTDAHTTFNGKVVFDNVIWYTATSNGFWMDAVFTGLDPAKEYEFATSANRGGSGSDYASRYSKFTITDMDSAENGSTPGVTVNSDTSVTFCTGMNTVNGYVARWTKIKCGSDGDFTVRVEDGGGVGKGYAFDGIMLRESVPQTQTVIVTADSGQSKVFGEADPVLTYVSSIPGVTFTGALSRAAGENVGSYAINQGDLSAGENYVITFVPADFTITAKPITVTADSGQSKVFGASDPVLTYVSSDLGASFTGALGRAAGEDVGSYTINQGDLSAGANYAITFVPADFAITAASSTTAISSSLNPSDAGSNVTFTVTVGPVAPASTTPTGNVQFLTNDVAMGSPVALAGGTVTFDTALLPTGTNTVTANYLGDANYLGSTDNLLQVVKVVAEPPSVVSILPNGDGSVTVTFAGTPGAAYLVLDSTSIVSPVSWVKVSTNTAGPDGRWTYTDNTVPNYTQRFFRAAKP